MTFGLGALILSALFAALTYVGVHHELVNDLQHTDLHESFENAELVRYTLYTSPPNLDSILNSIETATDSAVLVKTYTELSHSDGASIKDVPADTQDLVTKGEPTAQILNMDGKIMFVVGIPIPAVETQFYEVFPMNSLEKSLSTLLHNLLLGALLTSLIGIAGGLWVAQRAVRPLKRVSMAAGAIAEGNLSTRLQVTRADREVHQLTESFNQMVSQLVERLGAPATPQ
jgi:nitrogen fixation/metabolism regulation signal transduction histidine kinase